MLMFPDVCQNARLLARFIESAQSSLEGFIIPNYHIGHLISNPLSFTHISTLLPYYYIKHFRPCQGRFTGEIQFFHKNPWLIHFRLNILLMSGLSPHSKPQSRTARRRLFSGSNLTLRESQDKYTTLRRLLIRLPWTLVGNLKVQISLAFDGHHIPARNATIGIPATWWGWMVLNPGLSKRQIHEGEIRSDHKEIKWPFSLTLSVQISLLKREKLRTPWWKALLSTLLPPQGKRK